VVLAGVAVGLVVLATTVTPAVAADAGDADSKPLLVLDPGGHTAQAWVVLFTPDARQLVSVSGDKTVRFLDVRTGDTVRVIHLPAGPGHEGVLSAGALAPGGNLLAVGGTAVGKGAREHPIYLLSLQTGELLRVLGGNRQDITTLAFSPDGRTLASGSLDGKVNLYEVESGKLLTGLTGHTNKIRRVAFTPDGRRLASLSAEVVCLWSVPDGAKVGSIPQKGQSHLSLAWNPDGSTLATGALDGMIHLWGTDGTFRRSYAVLPTDKVQVVSLAYGPDGQALLYTGVDRIGRAGIFDLQTGKARPFEGHSNTVLYGSFSADGKLAVTSGGDGHEILVWQTADGAVVQKFQGAGRGVWAVGWAPAGKTIAWGTTNSHDRRTGRNALEQTFKLDDFEFGATLSTPDTPRADAWAAGSDYTRDVPSAGDFALERQSLEAIVVKKNGRPLGTLRSPYRNDRVFSFSVLPGNRVLLGTGFGLFMKDLTNGKTVRQFKGHNGMVLCIATSPDGRYFLTGSTDETMCIWSLDHEEPLLSLFVAGREWIAWTPEGYYAASAFGERLMGWLVNRGPDRLPSYFPAGQFRPSLYKPELLKRVLPAGGTKPALAQLENGGAAAVTVSQVLPPEATVTRPAAGRLDKGRFEVTALAKASGGHPVKAMRLLVDGRPWQGDKGVKHLDPPKAGEVRVSWEVDLPRGPHTLAVQAQSAVSKGLSDPVAVTVDAGDDKPPDLYVVAVGISRYPRPLTLRYAAGDAVALGGVLRAKGQGVFGKVEVKLLVDGQATRHNIAGALEWLSSVMTPRDIGILSFSGHGMKDRKGRFYIVPVDVDRRDPEGTCVPGDELKAALGKIPGRLVVLLDACHSGASAADGQAAPWARADDLTRDLVSDDYGVVVMAASLGSEYAIEADDARHGYFTRALLEGLSGAADYNHDRIIHLVEADRYVWGRVRQLSSGLQNPVTGRPPGVLSFPLSGVQPPGTPAPDKKEPGTSKN
jgi:WD40 repeat protein